MKDNKYCVEYYSNTLGDQTRCFSSTDERDTFLITLHVDHFYLYMKETKEEKEARCQK